MIINPNILDFHNGNIPQKYTIKKLQEENSKLYNIYNLNVKE
jgi:hypothetical protein